MMERIIVAAENAGFEYILIPVVNYCWEAVVIASFLAAKTSKIKPLIAAKPGYVNPVLFAKTMATLDQMTKGRLAINLIAGQAESDFQSDGIRYTKEQRYALMAEEVEIMKLLWGATAPIDFNGAFHTLTQASIVPDIHQKPHPKFYLGGGSDEAAEVSVRHSDVHLFWGDTPDRIASNISRIRTKAAQHGRADEIGFGMRLQIMCRATEDEAWNAARRLIERGSENHRREIISIPAMAQSKLHCPQSKPKNTDTPKRCKVIMCGALTRTAVTDDLTARLSHVGRSNISHLELLHCTPVRSLNNKH